MKSINELSKKHFNWLKSMNWNNSTNLEAAGMISSEIGETITEEAVLNMENLSEEMADIVLRTIGLTERFQINIENSITSCSDWNDWSVKMAWNERNNLEKLALIASQVSPIINLCRQDDVDVSKLANNSAMILISLIKISKIYSIDLENSVLKKINKNILKGQNGRPK